MAGQNVFTAIDALRVELNGNVETQVSRIDGKIEAQGLKIDEQKSMIWTLIGILCTAVLGGLAGLATLLYQMFSNAR